MVASSTNKNDLQLSIIVPAYQAEQSIGRLLRSLQTWDGDDMEVVVVDDGSTDGTATVVASFAATDSRIRLVSQSNMGRSAARNMGIEHAGGKWIMFADSDDYLLDSWQNEVSRALNTASMNLTVFSMVHSDGLDGFGNKVVVPENQPPATLLAQAVCEAMINSTFADTVQFPGIFEWNACWARLYKRELIEKVAATNGGSVFPVGLKFSEDKLFNLAYLSVMGNSEVSFNYTPLYYWDLDLSSTVSNAKPDDPEVIITFAEAADAMGNTFGFTELVPRLIAIEVASQFGRSALLPISSLRAAAASWQRVIGAGVLDRCDGLVDKCFGARAWLYKPSLTLLSASKPFCALLLAHPIKASGALLKSFRRLK